MKIEDLQQAWQEYNEKLQKNLTLNEELLRQMNIKSIQKEVQILYYNEFLGFFYIL
ncbi:MAG: hypothetical protein LUD15_11115 [Bacteroides sp.]|nr:hypothetical protein [Bacteroides sp.]